MGHEPCYREWHEWFCRRTWARGTFPSLADPVEELFTTYKFSLITFCITAHNIVSLCSDLQSFWLTWYFLFASISSFTEYKCTGKALKESYAILHVCLVWDTSWGTVWQVAEEVLTAHPSGTSIPEKMSDRQPCSDPLMLSSPSHKVRMHAHAQTCSSTINPPNLIWKVISLHISVWGLLLCVELKGWREAWLGRGNGTVWMSWGLRWC